jgi:hypothetical protein
MAKIENGKIVVTLSPEDREILIRLADALDRAHPKPSDMTFGTRIVEPHMVAPQHPGRIAEPAQPGTAEAYRAEYPRLPAFREPVEPPHHRPETQWQPPWTITGSGRTGDITKWGEGDWTLPNEDHTGEETE